MKSVAFVGWRGMVGSVLRRRLQEEGQFNTMEVDFFSTSQAGKSAPKESHQTVLGDAYNIDELLKYDIIVTCQGGTYTQKVWPQLLKSKFKGRWIDASSALRMEEDSTLILDPLNNDDLTLAISEGKKVFCGANCTVSLMLLALKGLIDQDLIEWVSSMTYQAVSGAGAGGVNELLAQLKTLSNHKNSNDALENMESLDLLLKQKDLPIDELGYPLGLNVLPFIDTLMENGMSREEWKAGVESSKILGRELRVDGLCVRVPSLRSHAQGLTIKLKKDLTLNEVEKILNCSHEWFRYVPNNKKSSLEKLTPAYVSGTLKIGVGRLRKMNIDDSCFTLFTVGDQLLWGAAEPLRRLLKILE